MRSRSFADPVASGQHLSFEYDGFTVQMCTRNIRLSNSDACEPQSTAEVIRRIRGSRYVTVYTVSSKVEAAQKTTVEFFARAEVSVDPPWIADYAEDALRELAPA